MVRGPLAVVLCTALAAMSAGCKKKAPVRAHGVIVDAVTGEPLAGIELTVQVPATNEFKTTAVSGSDGRFTVRGKLDIDKPFEIVAAGPHIIRATTATPRLPFQDELRLEVLSNDIPSGFSLPTAAGLRLGARLSAVVDLPPADRPTAPLRHHWAAADVTDAIPKLRLRPDGTARVVVAPPPEKCDCLIEPAFSKDSRIESDPTRSTRVERWMPKMLYSTAMLEVLEVPKGALHPGLHVFWPNQPPPYDAMIRTPDLHRTGYVFEVE